MSSAMATQSLFVYGTLMHGEIFQRVSGIVRTGEPATLYNYQRFSFNDKVFPGIVPQAGQSVEGLLYRKLTDSAMLRLDHYEGDWYQRVSVDVETASEQTTGAVTYIVAPAHQFRLSKSSWSYDNFVNDSLNNYLSQL